MPKCEWGKNQYDRDDAESWFSIETGLSYSGIRKNLCGDCAVQAIEDEVAGIYFEVCEECGKEFDFIEERYEFECNFSEANGSSLADYWDDKIVCCECAIEKCGS